MFDEPLGLAEGQTVEIEIRLVQKESLEKYGINPIASRGHVVTNEMVNEIREELGTYFLVDLYDVGRPDRFAR